jgi:uncharacterized YigZ family protein
MNESEITYYSPREIVRSTITESGSRFIADMAPAGSLPEAQRFIEKIRAEFPDATHHAYVIRLGAGEGAIEKASDDREPAGTAGAPMLQYLQGSKISDTVLVATRYFGGIKLGIGGLTRAYRNCAKASHESAVMIAKVPLTTYLAKLKYEELGSVTRMTESLSGRVVNVSYSDTVEMTIEVPTHLSALFREKFNEACRGSGTLTLY